MKDPQPQTQGGGQITGQKPENNIQQNSTANPSGTIISTPTMTETKSSNATMIPRKRGRPRKNPKVMSKNQPKRKIRHRRLTKKKVSRACNHCRKAHITCDESRPCKHCIARHLAATCHDAPRKTKKYLLEDLREQSNGPNNSLPTRMNGATGVVSTNNSQRPSLPSMSSSGSIDASDGSSKNGNGNTGRNYFLSSAADLEYSILGSIIDRDATGRQNSQHQHFSPGGSSGSDDMGYLSYQPLMQAHDQQQQQQQPQNLPVQQQSVGTSLEPFRGYDPVSTSNEVYSFDLNSDEPRCDPSTNQYFIGSTTTLKGVRVYSFPQVVKKIAVFRANNPEEFRRRNRHSAISFAVGVLDELPGDVFSGPVNRENAADSYGGENQFHYIDGKKELKPHRGKFGGYEQVEKKDEVNNNEVNKDANEESAKETKVIKSITKPKDKVEPTKPTTGTCGLIYHEPHQIYSQIKAPFPYVRPYHDLNLYLRRRFDKEHLVSMSKSISQYRPSFIAGMIHLKEDDLIFAEQCFQRTLLEYDNYISISGTPTLVWRRTSQIAYVGDEFCVLTGWSREQLLGKSTFAVQIMDDNSCVDYFRLFSRIAFGDFRGATMTECTLLTPHHESIRTSSVWTLKRDAFGIPMMIIANFLPILT